MLLLLQIIVITLSFISLEHETLAALPYTSVVLPIHKHTDASKPLYSVQVMTAYVNMQFLKQNLLIDTDAPIIWRTCSLQWNMYQGSCPPDTQCAFPVSCEEYQCTEARTSSHTRIPTANEKPTSQRYLTQLNYDDFTFNQSNGGNVYTGLYGAYPNAACAPSSSLQSFPANVTGVMALSSSPYALPARLVDPLKRVIGLCLPSTLSALGVLLYGDSPYYLLPQSSVDVRSYLSYTPLINVNHSDSFGYYIGVNNIVIKKRSIAIPADAITKISTTEPYTILRSDIYNPVVRRFSMVTKRIPQATPVPPFGLCFSSSTSGTQVSLKVPDIDFSLPEGKKWTMSAANSIKQVTPDVACLALVDGGASFEPAIVIGSFQMEDNFLVFNLENSTFGFSSSLLRKKTSCSNFNYTLVSSY
ncbi:unnamed protein product [Lactuca saligna]|uniref:Peptidase A1 domain-containing protein n=1 Tax=Lactuca saligna TaxID=75948 RepID=A0AA36E8Q4_LACSI|nr:unnamed protein product [Lactuca saligna]